MIQNKLKSINNEKANEALKLRNCKKKIFYKCVNKLLISYEKVFPTNLITPFILLCYMKNELCNPSRLKYKQNLINYFLFNNNISKISFV